MAAVRKIDKEEREACPGPTELGDCHMGPDPRGGDYTGEGKGDR